MLTALVLATFLTLPPQAQVISATALGLGTPLAVSGSPTAAIRANSGAGDFKRLTLVQTIVWGSTTTINVKIKVSGNGTTYGYLQRCTSATTHDCADRVWQWTPADGTTPALDLELNYPYITVEWTGTGTATVTAHAILAP